MGKNLGNLALNAWISKAMFNQ